jgi:flagellar biogenesis protein FliO
MDWSVGMRELQGTQQNELNGTAAKPVFELQGFAGWVMGQLRGLRSRREVHRRQLRLVETLSLGGKRQLMLVTCGGESFLVGGGMDCVETIVRLKTELSPDVVTSGLDESCR